MSNLSETGEAAVTSLHGMAAQRRFRENGSARAQLDGGEAAMGAFLFIRHSCCDQNGCEALHSVDFMKSYQSKAVQILFL